MTLQELRQRGYRIRFSQGHWTLYQGAAWNSRWVASGKLTSMTNCDIDNVIDTTDKKAVKAIIGAASADFVLRRVS